MVLDSARDSHFLNLFTCPVIWFKSFWFCRLNLTDIDREQTIYRSCEKLEFPAAYLYFRYSHGEVGFTV